VVPDGAIVTPRDRTYISGDHAACTDVLQSFEHVASLSFATPGTMIVRFRGRRVPGESQIEISHAIVVTE